MDRGRLVACDTPPRLREILPGTVLELRGPAPEAVSALLSRLSEVREAQVFGDTLHLVVTDAIRDSARIRTVLQGQGVVDVQLRPIVPSLEDIFVALLRERKT